MLTGCEFAHADAGRGDAKGPVRAKCGEGCDQANKSEWQGPAANSKSVP